MVSEVNITAILKCLASFGVNMTLELHGNDLMVYEPDETYDSDDGFQALKKCTRDLEAEFELGPLSNYDFRLEYDHHPPFQMPLKWSLDLFPGPEREDSVGEMMASKEMNNCEEQQGLRLTTSVKTCMLFDSSSQSNFENNGSHEVDFVDWWHQQWALDEADLLSAPNSRVPATYSRFDNDVLYWALCRHGSSYLGGSKALMQMH